MTIALTRKIALLLTLMLIFPLTGCDDEVPREKPDRPDVGEDGVPPPPTPEEVAQQIIAEAQLNAPMPRRGASLPPAVRQTILDLLRRERNRLKGTEDGDQSLAIVAAKVDEKVRQYERAELWEYVITMIDAHLIFNPGSVKFSHIRDKALIELRKPKVTVTGIPDFNNRKIAMLRIYLPLSSETFSVKMSIGEEMHGLRFLDIFGNNRGVRLEYIETGERFIAYVPAAK